MATSNINILVDVLGTQSIKDLSVGLRNLIGQVNGVSASTRAFDARQRALNAAMGNASSETGKHAKTVSELTRNQAALSGEVRKVNNDLKLLNASYKSGLISAKNYKEASAGLTTYGNALKGIKIRAFASDLQSVGQNIKRLGKDAQFTGRSLIIGLTTPMLVFGRTALYSIMAVDRETVRLTKLLENSAMNLDQAYVKLGTTTDEIATKLQSTNQQEVEAAKVLQERADAMLESYRKLNAEIQRQSLYFGVAQELVTAVAGDFAELGFAANESVTQLAELTFRMEKLGSLDTSASQQFVQSVFQQTARVADASGRQFESAAEREKVIIGAVTAQLAMFNTVENVTALSLRDLADAFPEMSAAATSFGLSMTEAAALLAPMKAAGFEIGASANSIKVSLQRLVAPTKANLDLINQLADSYAKDLGVDAVKHFEEVKGAGIDSLQSLVDMFIALDDNGKNTQATMEFFAKIFGVRQGPRMERSIAELAMFQQRLTGINSGAGNTEAKIRQVFNTAYEEAQKANGGSIQLINTIEDIGIAARIATAQVGQTIEGFGKVTAADIKNAKDARQGLADFIKERSMAGEDVFAGITTQAGKVLVTQMAGASSAMDIADKELKQVLGSLSVQFDRLKVAFKITAKDLIEQFRPAIEKIIDSLIKFMDAIRNMDPAAKKFIGILAIAVASIGPLVFAFGQVKLAGGVMLETFARFLPGLRNLSIESVAAAGQLQFLRKPLVMVGNTVSTDSGKFSIFIAKLASMENPVGRLVRKFGQLSGVLKQTSTASAEVQTALTQIGPVTRGSQAVQATEGFLGTPKFDRSVENKTKTLFRQKYGLTTSQYQKAMSNVVETAPGSGKYMTRSSTGQFAKLTPLQKKAINAAVSKDKFDILIQGIKEQAAIQVADDYSKKVAQNLKAQTPTKTPVTNLATAKTRVGESITSAKTKVTDMGTKAFTKVKDVGSKVLNPMVSIGKKAGDALMHPVKSLKIMGGAILHPIQSLKAFSSMIMHSTKVFNVMKFAIISSGIGLVLLAVAAVVMIVMKNFDKFKKAVEPAIKAFKDTFNILKEALMSIIQPFLDFIAGFISGSDKAGGAVNGIAAVINFLAKLIKGIASVIAFLMRNVIAKGISLLLKPIAALIRGIVNFIGGFIKIFKGDFMAGIKQVLSGVGQAIIGLMGPFAHVFRFIILGWLQVAKAAAWVTSWIPGLKNVTKGVVSALEGVLGFIDDAMKGGDGKKLVESATDGAEEDAKDKGEIIGDALGEGIEEGVGGSAGSVGQALRDMMQEFVDKTLDYVAENVKDYTGQLTQALQDQKEAALKVFDDQIKTIDALEKAEESLTRTKEYELKRREMLDERELNRQNYVRNRALAIYEGRIDDARMLDLEEQKAKIESAKSVSDLDTKRAEDLAKENRDAIREAIKEAKDAASEYYDSVIEDFQKAAEKITEFPPNTIDEFNNQLNQLLNAAKGVATDSNTEFANMMTELATKITTGLPNEAVGAFTTSLDQLVNTAVDKYGLGTDAKDNTTVIGATIGMLNAIPTQINSGQWSQQAKDLFGKKLDLLPGQMKRIGNIMLGGKEQPGSLRNIFSRLRDILKNNNPFLVWVNAMNRANKSIQHAMERTVGHILSKVQTLAAGLSPILAGIAIAMDNAANSGGGGGGGGGGAGSGIGTGPTGTEGLSSWRQSEIGDSRGGSFLDRSTLPRTLSPITLPVASNKLKGTPKFGYGGMVPKMAIGGYVSGAMSQSVPAILHGGEFVVSANAVKNIGIATLENLNSMRNGTPSATGGSKTESYSEQNINICVDNFIGEKQWFESMMKEYNIKVVPNNQRAAGTNKRVVRTYNGINRGM
jgi:TP901 family phage tail tape measure protein